jgi:mxaJ protein
VIRTAICILALAAVTVPATARDLRVCADPNNLPFSNKAGEGFENKIASLIAKDLHADVKYTWWAQRRGFVRNTLKAGDCDLWPGVAAGMEMLTTTEPYYRSSYVFVSRAADSLDVRSFDDPRLRTLSVGVQMVGNDAMNTPPAHALARRGITQNVRGFMLYGDYTTPNPPAAIIDALAKRQIDIAAVWGPMAGYFASGKGFSILPATATTIDGAWPMTFEIAMGVRKGNNELKQEIDAALKREKPAIDIILAEYHVPIVPDPTIQNVRVSVP